MAAFRIDFDLLHGEHTVNLKKVLQIILKENKKNSLFGNFADTWQNDNKLKIPKAK